MYIPCYVCMYCVHLPPACSSWYVYEFICHVSDCLPSPSPPSLCLDCLAYCHRLSLSPSMCVCVCVCVCVYVCQLGKPHLTYLTHIQIYLTHLECFKVIYCKHRWMFGYECVCMCLCVSRWDFTCFKLMCVCVSVYKHMIVVYVCVCVWTCFHVGFGANPLRALSTNVTTRAFCQIRPISIFQWFNICFWASPQSLFVFFSSHHLSCLEWR